MSGNPFGAEIDALTTELFELNSKIAGASGSVKEALQVERSAKLKSLTKLDAMSDDWRLGRLSQAVDALKSLAASELARQAKIGNRLKMVLQDLGIESVSPEPNEKQSNLDSIDNAPGTSTSGAIGSGDATPHRDIHVDAPAFDALSRVAQSEVGHFAKHGLDQLEGGVSAVVDTILNRVAHKRFPNSIEDVVNQPFQFSAINTLGSWDLLPSAKMNVQNIVRDYLEDRVSGAKGMLGGATHFLNPHLSSANALSQWGNHVVSNAVAEFGDNSKKDVHFHGFAPGTTLPDAYRITFGKASPVFDGRGDALLAATAVGLTQSIVATLKAELAYFDNGKHKEGDDEVWQRVGT
ncbi:MAG: cell wall hydrolase, partial [Hyphomicrobiales bacterium]